MANYEVVVGNIGKVYEGGFYDSALGEFYVYRNKSQQDTGRASGEPVTLLKDGAILREYQPDEEPEDETSGEEQKGIHEFTTRELEILDLLWDSLKRDPEHKDRRQTGWGTKTRVGLIACIDRLTK